MPTAISLPAFLSSPKNNALSADDALLARISSPYSISIGPKDARVVVVEFFDFQCPFCKAAYPTLTALMNKYKDSSVRFEFRQFPLLSIHPFAVPSAHAGLCAHEQGKFMEFYGYAYENQERISRAELSSFAQKLELNLEQYNTCTAQKRYESIIKTDLGDAIALGLAGTPSWFINHTPLVGALPLESFEEVIDAELKK